ncbi:MAG: redox-sensing transcriptional repressor Rex [Planctomycetia bacterium]|nr:redox-sensing transcriptional repressor Rex [Planctomycetia bacterium]
MGRIKLQNTPAIRRLPSYLHKLMLMQQQGEEKVSTTKLADYMNLDPIVVRKDFALTGSIGQPGVGFQTSDLIHSIRDYLGWNVVCRACLIGAGSLGSALLGYHEFSEYGLEITSVFDSDPEKIGRKIHGYEVLNAAFLNRIVRISKPNIAILTVSAANAQAVCDELMEAGVKAFWNFSNVSLQVPENVIVQREVIAGGFALLSAKLLQQGLKVQESEGNHLMTKIVICMGSSCFARGNEDNLRVIEEFIETNNFKAQIELSGKCCVGQCSDGPNIIIDGVCYHHMDKGALIDLLNEKFNQEQNRTPA